MNSKDCIHCVAKYVECGKATCGVHYDLKKVGALSQDYGTSSIRRYMMKKRLFIGE